MHANSQQITRRHSQGRSVADGLILVDILDLVEALQHTDNDVTSLSEGELLTNADARTTVEGNILPSGLAAGPALGLVLFGVGAPDVLAAVHDEGAVGDGLALADEDGGCTIGTTAVGNACVLDGCAAVEGDDREQTERLVHDVLEVLARLEGSEGEVLGVGVGAEVLDDDFAQLVEDIRVASKHEEGPAEQRGGGITTGEEDVQQLAAEFDGVPGSGDQSFEEDVGSLLIGELLLVLGFLQCGCDNAIHEILNLLIGVTAFLVVCEEGQAFESGALSANPLGLVEVEAEVVLETLETVQCTHLRLGALAEQEFSGGVHSQTEEDGLDIGSSGPSISGRGQSQHGLLDVGFLQIKLADLIASELGAQQATGVAPFLTISGELYLVISTCCLLKDLPSPVRGK